MAPQRKRSGAPDPACEANKKHTVWNHKEGTLFFTLGARVGTFIIHMQLKSLCTGPEASKHELATAELSGTSGAVRCRSGAVGVHLHAKPRTCCVPGWRPVQCAQIFAHFHRGMRDRGSGCVHRAQSSYFLTLLDLQNVRRTRTSGVALVQSCKVLNFIKKARSADQLESRPRRETVKRNTF